MCFEWLNANIPSLAFTLALILQCSKEEEACVGCGYRLHIMLRVCPITIRHLRAFQQWCRYVCLLRGLLLTFADCSVVPTRFFLIVLSLVLLSMFLSLGACVERCRVLCGPWVRSLVNNAHFPFHVPLLTCASFLKAWFVAKRHVVSS